MALHVVYHAPSLAAALSRAASLGGDADSVCSVTGQIAGAMTGVQDIPPEWLQDVLGWDDDIVPRARALFRHTSLL